MHLIEMKVSMPFTKFSVLQKLTLNDCVKAQECDKLFYPSSLKSLSIDSDSTFLKGIGKVSLTSLSIGAAECFTVKKSLIKSLVTLHSLFVSRFDKIEIPISKSITKLVIDNSSQSADLSAFKALTVLGVSNSRIKLKLPKSLKTIFISTIIPELINLQNVNVVELNLFRTDPEKMDLLKSESVTRLSILPFEKRKFEDYQHLFPQLHPLYFN
ncbi:hypothetical protein EIN_373460 [Entamoeba invadens IP1]|uniref:Uncharacterized protein n=1 Tax=Entamoeba invadens IP1 TaxID=370355 RepID=A0A0A1TY09_ENTIV|nr:hypothetical protein EIN_373460 [Entamoeba invadens IP1]ELP83391.1 hypothetical protein EIN_373460 [Entamoeba invadens IP1]|eukprot:XP_004182737.1 hypothetical protein EIN_373460 [Entamoeba invadens IP1]